MKCPIDGATLLISQRDDIEIDYCPDCRGVWLDRGELDKLVARDRDDDRGDGGHRPSRDDDPRRPKKKKGWLGDIFELGG